MRKLGLILTAVLAVLPGCSKGRAGGKGRTHVTVSTFPIYDLTRRVAGPDADVSLVVPAGRDEHTFEPTPKDVEQAKNADLGVMVGLGLDPWMEKVLKDAAPKARLLKVGDRVPTLSGEGGDGEDRALDPHVWLDPERARLIVRAIAEELGRIDGPHALAYRERATELDKGLAALDKEVDDRTKAWKTRGFVTFHGSFQYFAERYKLTVVGVVEPVPGAAPSADHVAAIRQVIDAKNVPALYTEPQLDPGPAKALADAAKIPLGTLDPIGGSPETDAYEKLIRYDVAQLEKYLR